MTGTWHRWIWLAVAFWVMGMPAGRPDTQKLFDKNCAACHGKDGKAQTPIGRKLKAKDLSESVLDDAAIAALIGEGRRDDRGNIRMPAFEGKLSMDQVEALIEFVKAFRK